MEMMVETKNLKVFLTEIQNINGSLDGDENFRNDFIERHKNSRYSDLKEYFGLTAQKTGADCKMDFTTLNCEDRYTELVEFFNNDKENAEKFKRPLSIFVMHIEPIN